MAYVYKQNNSQGKPYGKWKYRFTDWTGKKVKGTGTNSKKFTQNLADEAEAYHRAVRSGHLSPDAIQKKDNVDIEIAIKEYLNWGEAQGGVGGNPWNTDHLRHRKRNLNLWKEKLGLRYAHDLQNKLSCADRAIQGFRREGVAGKTINGRISSLTSFCNWLVDRDRLNKSPFVKLKNVDETPTFIRRPMLLEEFALFLDNCSDQEKLIFAVMGCYGTRKSETAKILVSYYNKSRQCIDIPASFTKNKKPATLHLTPELCGVLDVITLTKKPNDPLFDVPSHLDRVFNRILKKACIPKDIEGQGRLDLHALRTTSINLMLDTDANMKEFQDLARHSDISTSMKYYARSQAGKIADYQKEIWNSVLDETKRVPFQTQENEEKL
jgi:integrase/recombinase XerD